MKMLFTKWAWVCSALLFFGMFSLNTQNANAQVLIEQGFDATATPANWTYVGFTRVAAPNAPCAGLGSLRRNLWTSTPTGSVAAPLWTSNGDNINVTFDFKLLNWQGTLSPANVGVPIPITGWGSLQLQLSTDAGVTYTTVFTVNSANYTPSTACSEYTHTINGSLAPAGSSTRIRLFGQWLAGDYYMYFDDVRIEQLGIFDCPLISANFGAACDDGNIFTTGTTIDNNCNCTGGTTIVFAGCNTGTPFLTLAPVCSGPQVNAAGSWTNEYSTINIVDANVSYQFFTSNANYFVTVTNSNATTILAFGQGSVNYTPLVAGTYRMYSHIGPDCPTTSGGATTHTRSVLPGACDFDCPVLEANIGDVCTIAGFFDATVNGVCECVGTAFDCDLGGGVYANIGDACTIAASGDSYSETVATEALGFPNTFAANAAYTISVPAGLVGDYNLNITAAGEVLAGSWRNEFRVQILDPNGVNVTNGAPGGEADEWQPSLLSQPGLLEGSLNIGSLTDVSGDWTVLVRLSFNEGPQVNANIDITLSFEPVGTESTLGDNCVCIGEETPFEGCVTANSFYGELEPACGATASSPSDAYTYEFSPVTVVAGDDYVFTLSNPNYYVTVSSVDLTILAAGQGSVSLTAPADGVLLMFSHIDADCSTTSGPATSHTRSVSRTCNTIFDCPLIFANFGDACDDGDPATINSTIDVNCECSGGTVVEFEGCTTGPLYLTLSPVCSGLPVLASFSWTNEYSIVNVVSGVDYTFSLSNASYWVSVVTSDNSTVLAADQGSVQWTSTFDGSVRFYSHAGIDCPTTTGSATAHDRIVTPGACSFDCPALEANIGDACTIAGFFDAAVSANCECVGTPFDCDLGDGEYANFGDACIISGSGDSYSETVATEALGFPNTFAANAAYTISVPAGLVGDYDLNITAAGEVLAGSWRNEFRVQILDPNGVNVTNGAPGGNADEWQPSPLSQPGLLEGSLNIGSLTDVSGDWTVLVRLSFNEGPQVNANIDITLAFEPVGQAGIIGDDCACFVPCLSEGGVLSTVGSNVVCFEDGTLDPVTFGNAVLTGEAGDNSLWVLTPGSTLSVVATDATGPNFDLSTLAEGNYRIFHIAYRNDVDINAVLSNPANTPGCWDVSNPITITVAYTPAGGTITPSSSTTVCVGQGLSGVLATFDGAEAFLARWVLTDENGNVLGLRANNSRFNFDQRTPGTYRIYYVSAAAGPGSLNSTTNVNEVGPCASVSNFIEVTAVDCSGSALLTSQPNPTSGISQVSFSVDNGQRVQLEVYDLSGRQISTLFNQDANGAQNYTMQFDGSGLPNGVYIYRMTTESEVIIDKFMIAR